MTSFKFDKLFSSFRDPSGFVFKENGVLYRQINLSYQSDYEQLMNSGLFSALVEKGLLLQHKEVSHLKSERAYKILQPEQIPFISYPFEWSFSQYKDAALLILEVQEMALEKGMILKDASAYNVQFFQGRPILIDLLSFEKYKEAMPWVAYRQFCQHFLAPLALMSYKDLRLGNLLLLYLDGIPLDLTSSLLPFKTYFSIGLATHLHFHVRVQKKQMKADFDKERKYHLSKTQLLGILENLKQTILSLKLPKQKTIWHNYYDKTNYTPEAFKYKEKIIQKWADQIEPKSTWDAGANIGHFSRLISQKGIFTVATDLDPLAIEYCYNLTKKNGEKFLLPLILDLTNPSPSIGWQNKERPSFLERGSFDLTLCLALLHHLAISHNLPFSYLARLFAQNSHYLIIEFVSKEDSNAKRLLKDRKDIFGDYSEENFIKQFAEYFIIKERAPLPKSLRTLYLMEKKK